ncbi:MAG: ATP-binding cassette domain-containing protein [Gammaproteobacteria bacterium]|nr:ATP-binding cassette domain-containing protein [Gammaproteobacteria bacterium]
MLTFANLALRRGTLLLFSDVSFTIHKGRKVGLIGANGAGKTSLFKLITGELEADTGALDFPQNMEISYLEQEVAATSELALDYVKSGDRHWARIDQAITKAEQDGEFEKLATLHEQMDSIDGYTANARAEQLMMGLGFQVDEFSEPLSSFSGGWRIRLNLARTLMSPADLLLLDEPTNHLDLDAIMWLSSWIKQYHGSMILISHDREFLDETVNTIAYLYNKSIELFSGNFSQFEIIKAARLAEQQSSYVKQQREIRHMQDFVRRFRAKATKARQAQSRIKALERMEVIAPAHIDSPFSFQIPTAEKSSDPLLLLDQCNLGYTNPILSEVAISLHPGDRIGLLGHNGAGKTTLMKSLSGELPLLKKSVEARDNTGTIGRRIEGENLQIGYFSQHQVDDLDLGITPLTLIRRVDPKLSDQGIRNYLGGFDFKGDRVNELINIFSGGEKARLALALVAYSKPNLLLMDEPTNHLDIDMRQALTVALQTFDGAILLISHDRHLLANAVDSFLLLERGRLTEFNGDLEDYRRFVLTGGIKTPGAGSKDNGPREPVTKRITGESANKKHNQQVTKPVVGTTSSNRINSTSGKQARQLKTKLRTLETQLERLNRKLGEVEEGLTDSSLYENGGGEDLQSLLRDQLNLKDQIGELEESWLEMSTMLEAI